MCKQFVLARGYALVSIIEIYEVFSTVGDAVLRASGDIREHLVWTFSFARSLSVLVQQIISALRAKRLVDALQNISVQPVCVALARIFRDTGIFAHIVELFVRTDAKFSSGLTVTIDETVVTGDRAYLPVSGNLK